MLSCSVPAQRGSDIARLVMYHPRGEKFLRVLAVGLPGRWGRAMRRRGGRMRGFSAGAGPPASPELQRQR